jgi:hypothetical protein
MTGLQWLGINTDSKSKTLPGLFRRNFGRRSASKGSGTCLFGDSIFAPDVSQNPLFLDIIPPWQYNVQNQLKLDSLGTKIKN